MVLGWLTPATWVKRFGGEALGQARDEPLFGPVFDSKLGGASVSKFKCPTCNQKLIDEDYEGVPIHRCVFCDGTLIDRRKMTRISLRKQKGFNERVSRLAAITQKNGEARRRAGLKPEPSPFNCPNCEQEMRRGFYSYQYLVEVDKCVRCSMVWFDRDELEIIQYLIEGHDSSP
jgi:Zn-finger nucleic acid-binding protein